MKLYERISELAHKFKIHSKAVNSLVYIPGLTDKEWDEVGHISDHLLPKHVMLVLPRSKKDKLVFLANVKRMCKFSLTITVKDGKIMDAISTNDGDLGKATKIILLYRLEQPYKYKNN